MKLDRDRLVRAREVLGYGLEKTAEEAGISKNSVLRAEHEEDIRPSTARKIATALGVAVADLLEEMPNPKVEASEPPDTFVDRLLRAPTMPIEELSDEEQQDIQRLLTGGKPIARFIEEDPEWLRQLWSYLAEENFRRSVEDVPTETLQALITDLVAGEQPRLFEDERREKTAADVLYKRSVRFARALIVREELLRRGKEPPERQLLALRRYMNALDLAEDPALGQYQAEELFPPEQVAAFLAEDERDNERIKREMAKLNDADRKALVAASPALQKIRDAYARGAEERKRSRSEPA